MELIHADFIDWWMSQNSEMTTEDAAQYFLDEYPIMCDDEELNDVGWRELVVFHGRMLH